MCLHRYIIYTNMRIDMHSKILLIRLFRSAYNTLSPALSNTMPSGSLGHDFSAPNDKWEAQVQSFNWLCRVRSRERVAKAFRAGQRHVMKRLTPKNSFPKAPTMVTILIQFECRMKYTKGNKIKFL